MCIRDRARPALPSRSSSEEGPWTLYAKPSAPSSNSKRVITDAELIGTILSCDASAISSYRRNPFNRFDDPVPMRLADGPHPLLYDAQSEVVSRHEEVRRDSMAGFAGLAFLVCMIGFIPWGWYFFLRRLSELVAAVRGDR